MDLALGRNGQERGGFVSEARTGKRFPLELPIKIHKSDESGQHSGVTGNLSAAGVYIRADAALEVGSSVEFEIALPPEVTGAKENVIVQCRGRVVRTDEPAAGGSSAEARGVACVIDSYDFVRHS
jgi:PilZ domain